MKKTILFLIVLALGSMLLNAQVAVNTDGSAPDGSSILHVKGSGGNHFLINDVNGNVGIGTLSPQQKLHVIGNSFTSNYSLIENYQTGMHVGTTGIWGGTNGWTPNGSFEGLWVEYGANESGGIFMNGNAIYLWSPGDADILRVYDEDLLPSGDPYFVISGNGNVGIKTTNPSQTLHVQGNMRLTGFLYDVNNQSGSTGQFLSRTATGIDWIDVPSGGDVDWTISGSNMYAAVSGNVGIGTTSPYYPLHVYSTAENSAFFENRATSEPASAIRSYMYDESGTDIISSAVYGQDRSDNGFGIAGHNYWNGVGVGAWSYSGNLIEAYDGDYPGGVLEFYIDQNGNTYTNGSFQNFKGIEDDNGVTHITLKSIQSPEGWFEDFGASKLVNGLAIVNIDNIYSQVVDLDAGYQVFLTPISDEAVQLFIAKKNTKSFTVKGVYMDNSPADCIFDYRIVAKDIECKGGRFETIDIPEEVITERIPEYFSNPQSLESE